MPTPHPIYGHLAVLEDYCGGERWMIHDAPVALDEVLRLIESGWSTDDILKRHMLILKADLVEITLLHAFSAE